MSRLTTVASTGRRTKMSVKLICSPPFRYCVDRSTDELSATELSTRTFEP
jgi:hypothetical protein